ncbi:MAG: DoxX family protein [Patescibacteria group bacterium]
MSFLSKYESHVYALLRVVAGFLFIWYGSMKLFNFPAAPEGIVMPAFIVWIAGPIEFFGGLLIMLGLFTRPMAFLASGLMAVAYWMGHGTQALLPIVNKGDIAILYCFVFLFISAKGAGLWSVDNWIEKKKVEN